MTGSITLTAEQLERYSRHLSLAEVGEAGQKKLLDGRVLVVGAGGLGSPVSLYLTAAGVGTLGIIDGDTIELSNLQRQIVHFTPDLGRPKPSSAAEKLRSLNPDVQIKTYVHPLDSKNARDIIKGYDFVVDATDDFQTRFLINDICVSTGVPFSHGGVLRYDGQTMTVLPGKSACYRCVFGSPPPPDVALACSKAGIMGAVAGMLGTIQAAETLKYLTGAGDLLVDTLLNFDALTMSFRKIDLKRRDDCPACGGL